MYYDCLLNVHILLYSSYKKRYVVYFSSKRHIYIEYQQKTVYNRSIKEVFEQQNYAEVIIQFSSFLLERV